MQDIQPNVTVALQEPRTIKLQPGDRLNIRVFSRDKELVQMFNLTNNTYDSENNNSNRTACYTVNEEGQIDMPVLGLLTAQGLTRMELADLIKYRLLTGKLVRDPIVTVDYVGMNYYVMGEVGSPGRFAVDRDQITLLEAIAQAGDLTIQGKRDDVLVLRTENGRQTPYRIDLTQTESLYASPAYYLQQNDVIYVSPTKTRANQADLNANTLRTPGFWMSASSFIMSLILLLTR